MSGLVSYTALSARDCGCVAGVGVAGFDVPARNTFDAEAEEFGDDGGG